jgi:hypothetical protein
MRTLIMRTRVMGALETVAKGFCPIVLLGLAACATDPGQQTSARPTRDDPSKGIICTYDVPTGSSLREKKCTTPEERETERRQSEHQIVIQPAPGNAR